LNVKICVPVPAKNLEEALEMVQSAEMDGADIIEIRLDYMDNLEMLDNLDNLRRIVESCSKPLIATNRSIGQGGRCCLSDEQRLKTLIKAAKAGFEYIDIELTVRRLKEAVNAAKGYGAKIIISLHDFRCTPSLREMKKIFREQIKAGADICKIVTTANNVTDSIRCLAFTYEMSKKANLVCFAMGEKGLLSRALSPLFGASFTYASLGRGLETAPGQITIRELREIYGRLSVE
jgi:3-dehydroquinate dehydratase type I